MHLFSKGWLSYIAWLHLLFQMFEIGLYSFWCFTRDSKFLLHTSQLSTQLSGSFATLRWGFSYTEADIPHSEILSLETEFVSKGVWRNLQEYYFPYNGGRYATRGEEQSAVLAANSVSYHNILADKIYHWCNSVMNVMGATSHFWIGFKAHSTLLYGTVN